MGNEHCVMSIQCMQNNALNFAAELRMRGVFAIMLSSYVCLSVCPSVPPTEVLSKPLNVRLRKNAQKSSFLTPNLNTT